MKKVIRVYLTKDIPADDILRCCFTIQSLKEAIKKDEEEIITTQTHAISATVYEKGYDIILIAGKYQISFSDILDGKYSNYIREIKLSHNWEKMFYSGIFYIPGIFEYELY